MQLVQIKKGKVKFVAFHDMKDYTEVEEWSQLFLTSTLEKGEWLDSHSGHLKH
jgi:hypothetical protein